MKVDNAVIMAAGASSRFAPLSYEIHKGLIPVRGEILLERQIRQLKDAGLDRIYLITGYKAEQMAYLEKRFGVTLLHNPAYRIRNNHSSIRTARDYLGNSYICSSDNYFVENPFETQVDCAYYAAEYAEGKTAEWCMEEGPDGFVDRVTIGGENAWYMMGHVFWDESFSRRFLEILEEEYDRPETADKLWEKIYMEHLDVLRLKIRRYAPGLICEFDTLDELRLFDESYRDDTRSALLKKAAAGLKIRERDIVNIRAFREDSTEAAGFEFDCPRGHFRCRYGSGEWIRTDGEQ